MTLTLKSLLISLLLHASLFAALYLLPPAADQRFTQQGRTQVVSIVLSQEQAPASVVHVKPQFMPLTSELDSLIDRMEKTEPAERQGLAISLSTLESHHAPEIQVPRSIPDLPDESQVKLKRRHSDEAAPDLTIEDTSQPRPKLPCQLVEPPAATATAIEQFVGTEEESSADLSNNRPPIYPPEAIRQGWEGVVLLRLRIADSGKVENVKVIKSSGHPILDESAINAVATWTGRPAKRWGRPVESIERLPIRFRL